MKPNSILLVSLVVTLVGVVLTPPVHGDWVFSEEKGWENPGQSKAPSPPELIGRGDKALAEKRYVDAAHLFEYVATRYPETPAARKAFLRLLDAQYVGKDFDAALETITELLTHDYDAEAIDKILGTRFEIGVSYLLGRKRRVLGFSVSAKVRGVEILDSLVADYPYRNDADRALFLIANYYFDEGKHLDAEYVYNRLIQEYPQSKWRGPAEYQTGESALRRLKGVEYDLSPLSEAELRLKRYLARYPGRDKAQSARRRLQEIDLMRAERLQKIADFYVRERRFKAARIYLQKILKNHPDTPLAKNAEKVLKQLGKKSADERKAKAARDGGSS